MNRAHVKEVLDDVDVNARRLWTNLLEVSLAVPSQTPTHGKIQEAQRLLAEMRRLLAEVRSEAVKAA